MLKSFWYHGGRVLLVAAILLGAVLYTSYQGIRYKAEYAATTSAFRNISYRAERYYEMQGQSYAGFCTNTEFLTQKNLIESMERTGFFNREPYTVVCYDDATQYAVSMTHYIDMFGNPAPTSHLCSDSETEGVIEQSSHVNGTVCST